MKAKPSVTSREISLIASTSLIKLIYNKIYEASPETIKMCSTILFFDRETGKKDLCVRAK